MAEMNDHDLLIRLDTLMGAIKEKLESALLGIDHKADKVEFEVLKRDHDRLSKRVDSIETGKRDDQVRKDTIINIGQIGWRGLAGIAALIVMIAKITTWLLSFLSNK